MISFGPEMFGPGSSTPLNFLTRPNVSRDQIVLPEALLNEMEGLNSAADVTFLLTTNRAAELPLPDADARRQLLRLYADRLVLDGVDPDAVIARTEGVTAPFLKELLRRAALLAAEGDATGDGPLRVTDSDLATALDELLAGRSQLTRLLLGGQGPV